MLVSHCVCTGHASRERAQNTAIFTIGANSRDEARRSIVAMTTIRRRPRSRTVRDQYGEQSKT
jgi:hypothetical protein